MEQSLRNRLTYGPLMIAALLGMLYLDWWLEKTLRIGGVRPRGVGILILLLLILPPPFMSWPISSRPSACSRIARLPPSAARDWSFTHF